MKTALFISLLLLFACASPEVEEHPSGLKVTEIKPNRDSHIMKQNLLQLSQVYDLSPFLFTKKIQIKTDAIPQSHPVLTLNIRYTNYPDKILATFLHEQFHWWALMKKVDLKKAEKDLKKMYPKQTEGVYAHFLICYLEYKAMKHYLGPAKAKPIFFDFIQKDKIRPWIYGQVIAREAVLGKIFKKYKLIPAPLT